MIVQAKSLADSIKALKEEALVRLQKAVETGDLLLAWGVFETLEDHLPVGRSIINQDKYPLMREALDNSKCYWERRQRIFFGDMLEEEIWAIENPEEELPEDMLPFDREKAEAMMWEVLKNGYAGFTYDW